jgi:hypothetical protein
MFCLFKLKMTQSHHRGSKNGSSWSDCNRHPFDASAFTVGQTSYNNINDYRKAICSSYSRLSKRHPELSPQRVRKTQETLFQYAKFHQTQT